MGKTGSAQQYIVPSIGNVFAPSNPIGGPIQARPMGGASGATGIMDGITSQDILGLGMVGSGQLLNAGQQKAQTAGSIAGDIGQLGSAYRAQQGTNTQNKLQNRIGQANASAQLMNPTAQTTSRAKMMMARDLGGNAFVDPGISAALNKALSTDVLRDWDHSMEVMRGNVDPRAKISDLSSLYGEQWDTPWLTELRKQNLDQTAGFEQALDRETSGTYSADRAALQKALSDSGKFNWASLAPLAGAVGLTIATGGLAAPTLIPALSNVGKK